MCVPRPCLRSKFVSGVLGSRTSPTMLLAGGLIATAALNVAFGFSTSLVWFCTWWAMNGMLQVRGDQAGVGEQPSGWTCSRLVWHAVPPVPSALLVGVQGVGAPCCARILTSWFAAKERGTYWGEVAQLHAGRRASVAVGSGAVAQAPGPSLRVPAGMWNIAHNMGGFLAPILAGTAAKVCTPSTAAEHAGCLNAGMGCSRPACCSSASPPQMYGWQWGMFAPGIVGTVMGLLILLGVRDSPEASECRRAGCVLRDGVLCSGCCRCCVQQRAAVVCCAVGYPPVEAREETKAAGGSGEPAAKESLVSLLVNDCLK